MIARKHRAKLPVGRRSRCSICGSAVAVTHFKRHVNAHERNGTPTEAVNAEWTRFVRLWEQWIA